MGDIALKAKRLVIMINQFKTFEELRDTAAAYLKSLSYSSASVDAYTREWRNLGLYIKVHGIQLYNASVGVQYLGDTVGGTRIGGLNLICTWASVVATAKPLMEPVNVW